MLSGAPKKTRLIKHLTLEDIGMAKSRDMHKEAKKKSAKTAEQKKQEKRDKKR
jgi:hypothetical protein